MIKYFFIACCAALISPFENFTGNDFNRVDMLKIGMYEQQVIHLLGEPFITSPHASILYYVCVNDKGKSKTLILSFNKLTKKLVKIEQNQSLAPLFM